ncbi:MAG: hydroxymethylbilane synthase [Candidatus Binataceae bacterium]
MAARAYDNAAGRVRLMAFKLRIGSRPSALALAQTNLVKTHLERTLDGLKAEIVVIRTSGDKLANASLARVGGKGLFIRELEQALSAGRADIAVHSMKDLPALMPAQFRLVAVPERENPRDALVTRAPGGFAALPRDARVGTSSTRRRFEALRMRPDLNVIALRGNVDTRLARLAAGDFDAIILAVAGLKRLARTDGINLEELGEHDFVPSGGQGALALEALAGAPLGGSRELEAAAASLNDARALAETSAERAFLATIGASCVSPVGVKGRREADNLTLHALLFSVDGTRSLTDEIRVAWRVDGADAAQAERLGTELGRRMLDRGAGDLIGREQTRG